MLIAARDGRVWISLVMAPFTAGLLVRLFMIQHDCGHGSFLPSKAANEWIGRAIGVVTMTPYDHWRRCHAIHHATSGNLDRRGIGDIDTLTVREYFACDWRGRIGYRLYRHPLVMFGIGPAYLFLIANRLPFGFMRKGAMPWVSTMTTNAGILLAAGLLVWSVGLAPFLVVALPIIVIGGCRMKIRVGYELIYDFPQSTPMIMVLGIHFTRASERRARVARRAQGLAHDAHRANTWAAK